LTKKLTERRPTPNSLRELEIRAQALDGRSIAEVAEALHWDLPAVSTRAKGFVGQLLEAALGADPRAGDGPDFPLLGVELKSIPVGIHHQPTEATFCCSVTMSSADRATWNISRLRRRLGRVLWMPVQAASVAPLGQRRIYAGVLWSPSPEQWEMLRADWEDLIGAVGAGRSPSGHEGRVLQLRPKAARATARTLAPTEAGQEPTLPLGFYLRRRFTALVLRQQSWSDQGD